MRTYEEDIDLRFLIPYLRVTVHRPTKLISIEIIMFPNDAEGRQEGEDGILLARVPNYM